MSRGVECGGFLRHTHQGVEVIGGGISDQRRVGHQDLATDASGVELLASDQVVEVPR